MVKKKKKFWWPIVQRLKQSCITSQSGYICDPILTKPTIRHLCRRYSSLDWNPNITTILSVKGASAKVPNGGFC